MKLIHDELHTSLTWPEGYSNVNAQVTANWEGIEIDYIGTLDWEWIDRAREIIKQQQAEESPADTLNQ